MPQSLLPGLQYQGWCCRRSLQILGCSWDPEEALHCCGTSGTGEQESLHSLDIAALLTFQLWQPPARCTVARQVSLHARKKIKNQPSIYNNYTAYDPYDWQHHMRTKVYEVYPEMLRFHCFFSYLNNRLVRKLWWLMNEKYSLTSQEKYLAWN